MFKSIFLAVAFLALVQCGGHDQPAENVAARVASEEITVDELRRFAADTPALLRSEKAGAAAVKDYLQTMIDMELMIVEARAQGLEKDEAFVKEWNEECQKRLVEEYLQRKVLTAITISEDEVQERFNESKWSRLLKLAHIVVQTEDEAQQILLQLEQGKSFAELAVRSSLDSATAVNGGLLEQEFVGREDLRDLSMSMAVAQDLFEVPVGGYGGPFALGDRHQIFKVVEEAPAPLRYTKVFGEWLFRTKVDEYQQQLVAKLIPEYNATIDQESVQFLIEEGSRSSTAIWQIGPEGKARVLGRYDGGQFTVEDLVNTYWQARFTYRLEYDSEGITDFINTYLLSIRLFELEAKKAGIDRDQTVAVWLREKQNGMLLELLKKREVQARIDTTDEAARIYFDNNLHKFMEPKTTVIREILVSTREQADSLLRAIQQGADMEKLSVEHTTRTFAKGQKGQIHLHPYERSVFGPLHDQAMEKAPIDELRGPLELKEGYSIYKVAERIPARPETFEQAASRAKYWLRKTQENKYFEALMIRLRERYASQVEIFEENLKDLEL